MSGRKKNEEKPHNLAGGIAKFVENSSAVPKPKVSSYSFLVGALPSRPGSPPPDLNVQLSSPLFLSPNPSGLLTNGLDDLSPSSSTSSSSNPTPRSSLDSMSPRSSGTPRTSTGGSDSDAGDGVESQPLVPSPTSSEIKKHSSEGNAERRAGFFSGSLEQKVESPKKTSHGSLKELARERAETPRNKESMYEKESQFENVISGFSDEVMNAKSRLINLMHMMSQELIQPDTKFLASIARSLTSEASTIEGLEKRAMIIESFIKREAQSPRPQELKATPLDINGSNLRVRAERLLEELSKKIAAIELVAQRIENYVAEKETENNATKSRNSSPFR